MKTGNSDMCNPCATPFTNIIRWLAKACAHVAMGDLFGDKANTVVSGGVRIIPDASSRRKGSNYFIAITIG